MITDEQIEKAFENTNFGSMTKRDLVRYGLLKVACGYYNGHTLKRILIELALVKENSTLTKAGKEYLYDAFSNGTSV
jgi:hypothetical protein